MNKINIDGTEYEFDELSEEVKSNLTSLKFIDGELNRLKLSEAALQTARMAYSSAIKKGLEGFEGDSEIDSSAVPGDTISFD